MKNIGSRFFSNAAHMFGGDVDITVTTRGLELPTTTYLTGDSPASADAFTSPGADRAFEFIEQNMAPASMRVDRRRVLRKIDIRILPVMFACYWMQFLDKVLLNYSTVMGLPKELHLKGNDLSNAASAFYIAYLLAELPTAYLLQKIPAGKYLAVNMVLWGLVTACTASVREMRGLTACRALMGIFEASIAPCLTLITSKYYTKSEQPLRLSVWYCGGGVGQITGGLLSFGFLNADRLSITSWRIMFITLGAATVCVGIAAWWLLPSTPMDATFLTSDEIVATLKAVGKNQTGVQNTTFKWIQVREIFCDPQIYLMLLITMLTSISSGVIATYSATVVKSFGYSTKATALLTAPSGIISIAASLISGWAVSHSSNRWAWIAGLAVPGVIGGGLISYLKPSNHVGLLVGIYLINSITATLIIVFNLVSSNVGGQTKRAVAVTLVSVAFGIGNIIGPQTFQARDAPHFIPAKVTVLATQAAGAGLAVVLMLYYRHANKRKEARERESRFGSPGLQLKDELTLQWMDLTDRENSRFRYVS